MADLAMAPLLDMGRVGFKNKPCFKLKKLI